MADISNSEDVMDSRDVEERITELQDERASLVTDLATAEEELEDPDNQEERPAYVDAVDAAREALKDWDESSEADELKALEAFKAELEDYCPDWHHGTTLVRDSYWSDYVEEMLKDCGDLPKDIPSYIVIDWDATGANIQMDYTSGEFDGVTYWAR